MSAAALLSGLLPMRAASATPLTIYTQAWSGLGFGLGQGLGLGCASATPLTIYTQEEERLEPLP